ncbi:hypothetical protein TNCV_1197261 [Trichonephila clavipes]|uniref:Uncharacterized protein n=1 Tax=Trichonephila clavipes TaxID=2585209 RepID=A0A8X6RXY7_TRICX|nr:hypothetical protein TNCV_1197261 [Trichonephila clavipes]
MKVILHQSTNGAVEESVQYRLGMSSKFIAFLMDEVNQAPIQQASNSRRDIVISFKGATRLFAWIKKDKRALQ